MKSLKKDALSVALFLCFSSTNGEAVLIGCPTPSELNWQLTGPRGWQPITLYSWIAIGYIESSQNNPPRATEFKDQPTIENGKVSCRYLVQTSSGMRHYKLMSKHGDCKMVGNVFECRD